MNITRTTRRTADQTTSQTGQTTGEPGTCAPPTTPSPPTTWAIIWAIARGALLGAGFGFSADSTGPIELRVRVGPSPQQATAELTDPASGRSHTIELASPRVTITGGDAFTHIEVAGDNQDTILSATFKAKHGRTRLLYAKTSLLTDLGIKGGRYPAPTAAAHPAVS